MAGGIFRAAAFYAELYLERVNDMSKESKDVPKCTLRDLRVAIKMLFHLYCIQGPKKCFAKHS